MDAPPIEVLSDLAEANDVLAAAFSTDPDTRRILGDDVRHLRTMYDLIVPEMLKNPDSILLGIRDGDGLGSVAVCQGPGKDMSFWPIVIRGLPLAFRLGWRRTRVLIQFDREFKEHSPLRPDQLRLGILGTRPDVFGRGYGTALLTRIDEHVVSRGLVGVYLEAARDGYPRGIYERHGYLVEKEFASVAGPVVVMAKPLTTE